MDLLQTTWLGNPLRDWAVALGAALLTLVVVWVGLRGVIRRFAKAADRTRNRWDDIVAAALQSTRSSLLSVLALYVGANTLVLSERVMSVLESLTVIALLVQGGLWATTGLTYWIHEASKERAEDDPATVMTMNVIGITARLAIWSLVLLLALDNVGVDVTALVAGLGIGGVAVALAAQNILGDLFASLSIVLDKPFVLGDFLAVGDFLGSVEAIGLKTTRLRSLSGEQVVFSNADLLESRIRNYGRMFERRVVLQLGVTYQTPRSELEAIPGLVREAVERHGEQVRFDRSHMAKYGDSAIGFETVYHVLSPDYGVHMDIQQAILLALHEAFEARDIDFAYPTQTVFVEHNGPDS